MRVLGIDPGLSGAVVRLSWPEKVLEARRDFRELHDVARAVVELSPGCQFAALELVAAMPGQGVTSTFSFGRAAGVAMGALHASGLQFVEISPQRWQRACQNLLAPDLVEFDSRAIALRVFSQPELFKRKLDHATSDAALLAWYAASEVFCTGRLETSRAKDFRSVGSVGAITSNTPR